MTAMELNEKSNDKSKAPTSKPGTSEPMETVVLKAPHQHGSVHYKAGETISLPKADAEFVRKAQGIK